MMNSKSDKVEDRLLNPPLYPPRKNKNKVTKYCVLASYGYTTRTSLFVVYIHYDAGTDVRKI